MLYEWKNVVGKYTRVSVYVEITYGKWACIEFYGSSINSCRFYDCSTNTNTPWVYWRDGNVAELRICTMSIGVALENLSRARSQVSIYVLSA